MSTPVDYDKQDSVLDVQPAWITESEIGIGIEASEQVSPIPDSNHVKDTSMMSIKLSYVYVTSDDRLSLCTQKAGWLTDYLLTFIGGSLAGILLVVEGIPKPVAHEIGTVQVWVVMFLFASAVSALLGGFIHQYCDYLKKHGQHGSDVDAKLKRYWSIVLVVGSLPNFCLFALGSWLIIKRTSLALLVTYAGAGVYSIIAVAVGYTRRIKIHVFTSLPTICYVTSAAIYRFAHTPAKWILASCVVLLLSGCVVAFKISPSVRFFNHNALLHCCLIISCGLMFVSGLT